MALVLGLSAGITVAAGLLLELTSAGLTRDGFAIGLALVSCVFAVAAAVRGPAEPPASERSLTRPTVRSALGAALVVGLAAASILIAWNSAVADEEDTPFTQLWALDEGDRTATIGVRNREGEETTYRLRLSGPELPDGDAEQSFSVLDGQERRTTVELPAPSGAARLVVELFRDSETTAYRTVNLWLSPGGGT